LLKIEGFCDEIRKLAAMESEMILLPELLSHVREFARPQMQFVNEYTDAHKALRAHQMTYAQSLHDDVKAKLFTPEAAQVMAIFVPYIQAAVQTRIAQLALGRIPIGRRGSPQDIEDYALWRERLRPAMAERTRLHKELFLYLYGPPPPLDEDD
jgi:hypothetical protein